MYSGVDSANAFNLRFLLTPCEKWYDVKTTWHGESLLKCLIIHTKTIPGTWVKSLCQF